MSRGDVVSEETRSRIMSAVPQSNTSAEMAVRRLLWHAGVRYRVKNRDLPGSPDIANRAGSWAVFVHGCFWHGHTNCPKTGSGDTPKIPATNEDYWAQKFEQNRRRDQRCKNELEEMGFDVCTVWECELRDRERVLDKLLSFLDDAEDS